MADDNQITGKIVVETADAQAALTQFATQLQQTQDKMVSGFKQSTETSQQASRDIAGHFQGLKSDIQGAVGDITSTITKIGTVFVGIGAILAGGALFKGVVDTFVNMNSEIKKLSTVMGSSMGDAQAFAMTFERFGVSTDTVTSMMMRMTRQLKSNEDGFNANGVATRDASGAMLPMEQITENVITRLKDMKGGFDANALSQMAFGRGIQDITALLKFNKEAVQEMKDRLAQLGITMDENSATKARAFKEGMHDVTLVGEALKYKIGEELIPVLIQLGKFFADVGPPAIKAFGDAFRAAQDFMMNMTIIIAGLRNGFLQVWEQIQNGATFAFNIIKATIGIDMAESSAAAKTAYAAMQASSAKWAEQAVRDANDVKFAVLNAMQAQSSGGVPGDWRPTKKLEKPDAGGDAFVGKEKGGKGGGPSIVQDWQAQLDQLKMEDKAFQDQSLEMQKTFWATKLATGKTATKEEIDAEAAAEKDAEKARLQRETDFWKDKLAKCDEGTKEYNEVYKKVLTLEQQTNKARLQGEIDLSKGKLAAIQEGVQSQISALDQVQKLDKLDLEMKKENVNFLAQLGKTTKAQELQDYRTLLLQEQALNLKAAQDKANIIGLSIKQVQEENQKILLLKKQQQLDLKKVDDQIAVAESGTWGKIFNTMESSFTSAIGSMLQGTQSFSSIIGSLFKSLVTSLANMFLQMGLDYVKTLLFQTGESKVSAAGEITDHAAVAFAATMASISAIPIVGPAMAPEWAAANYGIAMGAMEMLGYETGAWDIPSKQIAMLHPGELVMPAAQAERFRAGDGGGGAGGPIQVHYHVSAVDAQSVKAFFMKHGDSLAHAVNRVFDRNGKPILGPAYR